MSEFKQLYEQVIEEFGGYEKCKEMLNLPNIDFIMNAQGLREHMLQYRRANNIFEVGDKVLEIGDDCEMAILIVNSITKKMMVCVNDGLDASYVLSIKHKPSYYVRHATDAEIAAGHRL